jgi:hypothetical protein
VLAMLYQCVGVNVGSKTMNMVGGGGINSPHPPTSHYQNSATHGRTGQTGAPTVRHRCANGHLQRLVLTASRWADGTPDSEQSLSGAHLTVRCAGYNLSTELHALGFLEGKGLPRANLAPLDRGRTGQSGAPWPDTLSSVFC